MKQKVRGFTLVEILIAAALSGITLTCVIQFFLGQLNQYRLISGNNRLCGNLRLFSKFFEKDTHNSLEFYVFDSLDKASAFKKGDTISLPKSGDCVLFVTERGIVEGGRGTIYYLGEKLKLNGTDCYPLFRSVVSFSAEGKISVKTVTETKIELPDLSLPLGYIKKKDDDAKIFYTKDHKYFEENGARIPGCRRGIYVNTILIQPELRGLSSETSVNFCFFSRNPRF
jgi:prepilin-type N-terminal cleavage/methylation domain-containing protein